jgi:hypothetical protein
MIFTLVATLIAYLSVGIVLDLRQKWINICNRYNAEKTSTEFDQAVQSAELLDYANFQDDAEHLIEQVENAIAELFSELTEEPFQTVEIAEFDLDSCDLPTLRLIAINHGLDGSRLNRKTLLKRLKSL